MTFCKKTSVLWTLMIGATVATAASIEVVLEPVHAMVVSAPEDGVLAAIAVDEGDAVLAGATLVEFERAQEELRVERAREVLRKREFDYAGVEKLFQDDMTSETEKLEKEIERRVAEIDLADAIEQRDRRVVKAVHAGTITRRHHEAGEYVERGTPLLELVDQRQLDARFYVRPAEGITLTKGDAVWVRVPLMEATVRCRVVFVDPTVDPSSGLMRVRARVENDNGRFKPGLRGWVNLAKEEPVTWP
ncbi:efflux RND transporter periplasmic adaptor subunit [Synoicihabitans lomoniglobus]|uniref:Efflux RND transporter periplasmic adaptor subunit n=1 Tax=Synoicihabitans lomoniglobus TaxID=2909285 RepID=A0AAE9ZY05_9BACT|nr:efflux RND transporter periplasmic adaptor subunit [Opitutaceae bacterium LMO-M01]WED65409.1 efflux RND transporter periplasmic adaptor subunit [Opitutaceae bacterium LMO-M01]